MIKNIISILFLVFIALSGKAQINFVENKGQWENKIKFKTNINNGSFFLEQNGFTVLLQNPSELNNVHQLIHGELKDSFNNVENKKFTSKINSIPKVVLHTHAYKVTFLGSNNNAITLPDKIISSYQNYYIGNDKTKWASNCKIYQAITYKNVYPNIDIRYYTELNQLKYDFIVHPGGNPNTIAMQIAGANNLSIKNKELIIGTSVGDVKELYPYTYQTNVGKREEVDCKYVLKDNIVSFKIKNYNANETLIIDPLLIFSSFTGSVEENWGYTATPSPDGSLYAAGIAFDNGYPVSLGAYQTTYGGGINDDAFGIGYDIAIFKFSTNGNNRLYATYLGGSGNEQPHSLVTDAQGNLIVAGRSNSVNYPKSIPQIGTGLGYDIVVTKFNVDGTALLGSIKMGGDKDDGVNIRAKYVLPTGDDAIRRNYGDDARSEVILDGSNNICLASCTQSNNFPLTNAIQSTFGGGNQDGVIIKFTPNLTSVIFSTYFGGNGDDACFVLAQNPITSNLYIAGATTSSNLQGNTTNVIKNTNTFGGIDGFITEITNNGTANIKTTYIGTADVDLVYGIKFDNLGFPYIMGTTTGLWPIINAPFNQLGGKQFICKLQPDLSNYVYSTSFGPNTQYPNLSPIAFLVDRCQNVYVSGWGGGINIEQHYSSSGTSNLTEVNPLQNIPPADGQDFYFFVLKKNAISQLFGSHFGEGDIRSLGDHVDGGTSRFDANGVIYQAFCACKTSSPSPGNTGFPTTAGVWSISNLSSGCNEAVAKIEMNFAGVAASVKATIDGVFDTIGCVPLKVNFIDTLAKGAMYIWDYGDPSNTKKDTTYKPNNFTTHTYNQVGTFKLTLITIDSTTCNIADTAYIHVKVGNNIVAPNFDYLKSGDCSILNYTFTNLTTAPNPVYTNKTFTWDFGDGSSRITTNFNPQTHLFPGDGTYKVTLLVSDTTFCNSPDSITKSLRISHNVKSLFTTSGTGCLPYSASFKNNSIGGLNWLWEFGDGTTSTNFEPTHLYNTIGNYNVRLLAFDSTSCNLVDTSAYFTITVYDIPLANFTWNPNPPIENTKTTFTNLSIGATKYFWNFGDGDTSILINPIHQFNKTDTFNVTIIAINNGNCADTIMARVPIIINPLLAVPNAFTPGKFSSGNYNNGIIKVEGFGVSKMTWKIYNRWGQVVFISNNISNGWDGTFKGALQPMDVYVYTLDVEFTDGKKLQKTGDITLLR